MKLSKFFKPVSHAGRKIWAHFFEFLVCMIAIFFLATTFFGVVGLLPKDIQEEVQPKPLLAIKSLTEADKLGASQAGSQSQEPAVQYLKGQVKETPLRIVIPKINVDASVSNPESTSSIVLDRALMSGAVRSPTSGLLGEDENVFLFGHSAYSKTLVNPAYRTFNGLDKLSVGDEIRVDGTENSHVYRIVRVSFLKDSEAYIDLSQHIRMLTLSTCNAFGVKEDRIVVQAEFVKTAALGTR